MKTVDIPIFTIIILVSLSAMVHVHAQQYPHGIGSNSSALYNSVGLTYQQCQDKISSELQKTADSLDRGKAVALAITSPAFQSKVVGHKYELTVVSTNDTWDNSMCGNVKRTAVGVGFNLLDTPDTYLESVGVAEDANMSQVVQVETATTPICHNNCPPAIPPNWSDFVPTISSDFHFNGVMIPNATIPVSIDLANEGNSTLYDIRVAFVDSPLLRNFKTGYGNFTLEVGQEKTISGTILLPSELSNVSSSLNWMVYAKHQDATNGSKEFHKTINLADNSMSRDNSVSFSTILPPLKQKVSVNEIKCKQGLQLIIKSNDYSPACVISNTMQKLIQRNWGESLDTLEEPPAIKKMDIIGLQQNYNAGQPIHAALRFTGWSYEYMPDMKILNATGDQVWFNCPDCVIHSEHAIGPPGYFGTFTLNLQDYNDRPPVINQTGAYIVVTSYENKTAEANFIVIKSENTILPSSFMPCDTPFPQNHTGIPVLYIPANSTGKLCVRYHNTNSPTSAGFKILDARNHNKETGISVSSYPSVISLGNSTIVYTINSNDKAGFYRMSISCPGMQLAVGYDGNSNFVTGDFPWLSQTFYCPAQSGDFNIIGLSGIGVKYIPYP